ncbi:hypothetical protein RQP46_002468 [Phenoliferia psychrophenolica]
MDPFYTPPSGWEQTSLGSVLKNRTVVIANLTLTPVPVEGYQLLYRTSDAQGKPRATVTTIMVPVNASSDKLVAYNVEENSNSLQCAPSFIFQDRAPTPFQPVYAHIQGVMQMALAKGWIVTSMDSEGLNSAYTAGPQQGRMMLDSIRATLAFGETVGLLPTAKTVMWGYSGGAITTSWAEALLESYAPELAVIGGGTPADLLASLENLNGGYASALVVSALLGLGAGFPAFNESLYSIATPKMLAFMADDIANVCTGVGFKNPPGVVDFFADDTYFTTGNTTLSLPAWQKVFAATHLGTRENKALTPKIPVHMYHAINDELIPYTVATALVSGWCANGANLEFVTETTSTVAHGDEELRGAPGAMAFFADRFAGKPFAKGCTYTFEGLSFSIPPSSLPTA